MKNKYLILAALPMIFQNALYCADINTILKTELQNALRIMNIRMNPELEPVLHALVKHGKKSDAYSVKAINAIKDIKNALLLYRSEQYTSNWMKFCKVFNVHPEKVSQEIDPALKKVNNALQELQANASIYGYVKAGALVAVVLATGAVINIVSSWLTDSSSDSNGQVSDGEVSDDGNSEVYTVSFEQIVADIYAAAGCARSAADALDAQACLSAQIADAARVYAVNSANTAVEKASQGLQVVGCKVDNSSYRNVCALAPAVQDRQSQSAVKYARAAAVYADSLAGFLDNIDK